VPAPTRKRKPSLKQRIEIAAFAMFEEMGIGHVSVDAIAEAAETNKMGVYRKFESKNALIET
jgi:AcrR family transcriptional regulator